MGQGIPTLFGVKISGKLDEFFLLKLGLREWELVASKSMSYLVPQTMLTIQKRWSNPFFYGHLTSDLRDDCPKTYP